MAGGPGCNCDSNFYDVDMCLYSGSGNGHDAYCIAKTDCIRPVDTMGYELSEVEELSLKGMRSCIKGLDCSTAVAVEVGKECEPYWLDASPNSVDDCLKLINERPNTCNQVVIILNTGTLCANTNHNLSI